MIKIFLKNMLRDGASNLLWALRLRLRRRDLLQSACDSAEQKDLIIVITSSAVLSLTQNLMASAEAVGTHNILLICLDHESQQAFPKHHTFLLEGILNHEALFGSKHFHRVNYIKLLLLQTLLREDYRPLFIDSDIFLFSDPWQHCSKDVDIVSQSGSHEMARNHSRYSNTGFLCLNPTPSTKSFINRLIIFTLLSGLAVDDQSYFNIALQRFPQQPEIRILDLKLYPNGRIFWRERDEVENPVLVHNNFVSGTARKIERFKEEGLWLV